MDRLTGKDAQLMMEAVANVYEKKGDCVDKSKKTKHNCAKKVCSEQWGEGTCVPEHHTLLEDGTVTHYDVVFEHGLERMVPVEELEVLVTEMHEHAAMEGEELQENRGRRAAELRAAREAKAAEQDKLYRAGGGDAKRQETRQMQGASRARVRRPGMTRDQVIELGRKNLAAKDSTSTGTAPAAPANNAAASKAPAPAPAKTNMAGASKEDRMAAWAKANPKLAAAKAARDASRGTSASTNPMMKDMPGKRPAPAPTGGAVGSAAAKPAAAKPAAAVGSAAGGIRNPMKGRFTVDDKVSGTSNTYKPGQKMSAGDSSLTQAAQSALRAGSSAAGSAAAAAKPAGSPAAQAAAGAPNRKEDLFTGKPIPSSKPAAAAPVVKKKPAMGARNRMRMEEVDIFDTIKEYLIGEGATEEEALKQMLTLTDEQRTEIIEGSCGSKKKKKSKKGGY
jgi:hypothetical protein